jgi:16S rRNA (guanine(966)-N(2))-methyltransferase RsmD
MFSAMRIIAGEHRGRRIEAPPGLDTRPMLDRVREAMFSTLGDRVVDAAVLDLFAGSGSLGLEAASRGALSVRSIEKDPRAVAILRRNVEALDLSDRVEVVRGDALRPELWSSGEEKAAGIDLVFLDPPYSRLESLESRGALLEAMAALLRDALRPGGVLVIHVPSRATASLAVEGPWRRDERRYGNSGLLYLHKPARGAP